VLRRAAEVGAVVRPGDVLVELAREGAPEVRVTPDEVHLGALAVGQPARVSVEAFPDRPLRARVSHIAPSVDPARGTVEVRLAVEDEVDGLALRPDLSATVEVLLGEKSAALVLPSWLVRDLGTPGPWVLVAREGLAERRSVSVGLIGDEAVEVASGLEATDAVLPPDADVAEGEPVRARPPRPALPEG
jgi:HlyD family secretion protein